MRRLLALTAFTLGSLAGAHWQSPYNLVEGTLCIDGHAIRIYAPNDVKPEINASDIKHQLTRRLEQSRISYLDDAMPCREGSINIDVNASSIQGNFYIYTIDINILTISPEYANPISIWHTSTFGYTQHSSQDLNNQLIYATSGLAEILVAEYMRANP